MDAANLVTSFISLESRDILTILPLDVYHSDL